MSPTIFRYKGYRFYFFSREEKRLHVHISCTDGEAKFWLEPIVSLCGNWGLTPKKLKELQKIVEGHNNEITKAWKKHFKS